MQVGREVVVSEMGNVRETISDIREHPETFMSKITELLKGIWNTIKSAGLIGVRITHSQREIIVPVRYNASVHGAPRLVATMTGGGGGGGTCDSSSSGKPQQLFWGPRLCADGYRTSFRAHPHPYGSHILTLLASLLNDLVQWRYLKLRCHSAPAMRCIGTTFAVTRADGLREGQGVYHGTYQRSFQHHLGCLLVQLHPGWRGTAASPDDRFGTIFHCPGSSAAVSYLACLERRFRTCHRQPFVFAPVPHGQAYSIQCSSDKNIYFLSSCQQQSAQCTASAPLWGSVDCATLLSKPKQTRATEFRTRRKLTPALHSHRTKAL